MIKKITPEQIENILGFTLDESDKIKIKNYNLEYLELDKQKRDECILEILNVLSSEIKKSGEHRIKDWEIGWGENLENFKKNNLFTKKTWRKGKYMKQDLRFTKEIQIVCSKDMKTHKSCEQF